MNIAVDKTDTISYDVFDTTDYQIECLRGFVEHLGYHLYLNKDTWHIKRMPETKQVGGRWIVVGRTIEDFMSLRDAVLLHNYGLKGTWQTFCVYTMYGITPDHIKYFRKHLQKVEKLKLVRTKSGIECTSHLLKFIQ